MRENDIVEVVNTFVDKFNDRIVHVKINVPGGKDVLAATVVVADRYVDAVGYII